MPNSNQVSNGTKNDKTRINDKNLFYLSYIARAESRETAKQRARVESRETAK